MVLSRFVWSITLYLTLHAVKPQDGTLGHHPQPQLSRNIIISFNVNLKSINTWTDFYRYSALISDDTGVWLFGIGLTMSSSDIFDPAQWKGQNNLGTFLESVRASLRI